MTSQLDPNDIQNYFGVLTKTLQLLKHTNVISWLYPVKHMYSPCWTKVLRGGVAPVGLPAPPLLYLSSVRAICILYGDVLSSQLSQAIYNNTIIWSDMNIIKNIDFTRTEVSCSTTCSKMKFYPWGACVLSGDLIDCSWITWELHPIPACHGCWLS